MGFLVTGENVFFKVRSFPVSTLRAGWGDAALIGRVQIPHTALRPNEKHASTQQHNNQQPTIMWKLNVFLFLCCAMEQSRKKVLLVLFLLWLGRLGIVIPISDTQVCVHEGGFFKRTHSNISLLQTLVKTGGGGSIYAESIWFWTIPFWEVRSSQLLPIYQIKSDQLFQSVKWISEIGVVVEAKTVFKYFWLMLIASGNFCLI